MPPPWRSSDTGWCEGRPCHNGVEGGKEDGTPWQSQSNLDQPLPQAPRRPPHHAVHQTSMLARQRQGCHRRGCGRPQRSPRHFGRSAPHCRERMPPIHCIPPSVQRSAAVLRWPRSLVRLHQLGGAAVTCPRGDDLRRGDGRQCQEPPRPAPPTGND